MSNTQRKFIAQERSVPKQSRVSYQYVTTTQKDINQSYQGQLGFKKQLFKNTSDIDLRQSKQQYFKNLNQRRKNQGQMSNLKSQLQNLKNQVSKLISKETIIRTPQKQRPLLKQEKSQKKINYVSQGLQQQFSDKDDDFDDVASMSSVTTEKVLNQPLRRLENNISSQNFDQGYYQKLQNDLLKTEIRNLKNKYVSKKRELTEKCELLEKKNQFLEISLHKSQEALIGCRKTLEMEISGIKRQISQKQMIRNSQQPENDSIQIVGNDVLKEKIKRLYDQLTEKNQQINNLNVQIEDLDTMLERKKFDLKKQVQKNHELSKQLELSKCQQSRLQQYLQTQMTKRKDLFKQNENLKEKNKELMNDIYSKQQIVSGSEQYENRLNDQIQEYQKKEDEFLLTIAQLREENRRLKQINDSDKDQIEYLKKNYDQSLTRIAQINKKMKEEEEKIFQKEDFYKKLMEENKRKEQQRIKILNEQYQMQSTQINQETFKKVQNQNVQIHDILREKDKQINKWKAEYKILKLKHQDRSTVEKINKQEIQNYYKGFTEFKHNKELLEDRIKLYQKNIQKYLKIINEKQTQFIKLELIYNKQVQNLRAKITTLQRDLESQNQQLQQSKINLTESMLRAEQQVKYRQDFQQKFSRFIHVQIKEDASDDEQFQSVKDFQITENTISQFNESDVESLRNIKSTKILKKSSKQQLKVYHVSHFQKIQLDQLSEIVTNLKKRLIQADQKSSKSIRQLKNKDNQILKLKKQIRELLETHEHQLFELKQKYINDKVQKQFKTVLESQKQVKQLCRKQIQAYKQKYSAILNENVEMKRKMIELEKELLNLRQQAKSLSHLYNVKCLQVEELSERHNQENTQKQNYIQELQVIKNHKQTNQLNEIVNLKEQIFCLRSEIRNLTSMNKKIETGSFDEAIRNQIESNKILREQLGKKNEEVYKVRDNFTMLRSQYDNLRSQVDIQKLKSISQKKNVQINYQIQIQNLKNKLSVEQKKLSSLEQKISTVIEENKKKDSFIQSYIMGKKLPQNDKDFVTEFIKQYEIQLSGKQVNDKLRADSHQLEKMTIYNYNLLQDLAQIKERMLLYETIQNEHLSIYCSEKGDQINTQHQFESPIKSQSQFHKTIRLKSKHSLIDMQNS